MGHVILSLSLYDGFGRDKSFAAGKLDSRATNQSPFMMTLRQCFANIGSIIKNVKILLGI